MGWSANWTGSALGEKILLHCQRRLAVGLRRNGQDVCCCIIARQRGTDENDMRKELIVF
jgi:hypothetical protein